MQESRYDCPVQGTFELKISLQDLFSQIFALSLLFNIILLLNLSVPSSPIVFHHNVLTQRICGSSNV